MADKVSSHWKLKDKKGLDERYKKHLSLTGGKEIRNKKKLERYIRKILFSIFLISFIIFIVLIFFKPPLPEREDIIDKLIHQEPFQNKQVIDEQILSKGDLRYKIIPKFSYELYGLVVTEYNAENYWDVRHENDPAQIKDLCVVWGENILSGAYKKMNYSSGEFTCFTERKKGIGKFKFSGEHLSNNHLVPANEKIAEEIRRAYIGDQVYIKGYLSSYEVYDKNGNLLGSRGTSVRRDDGGNGACETIFVTDFEILRGRNYLYKLARDISGIIVVVSLFLLTGFFLFA